MKTIDFQIVFKKKMFILKTTFIMKNQIFQPIKNNSFKWKFRKK